MQTEQFMQFVREPGRPVLSSPPDLVWSLYKLHETPKTERSDQFAQFISLHSVFAFVCVVYVCWCVCTCVFVCATYQCLPSPARAVEGWRHSGLLALFYGGSFAMGHFPPFHMTALQPY